MGPSEQPRITTARPDQAEEIAYVHHQTWREAYSALMPESAFDEAELQRKVARWRDRLRDPHPDMVLRIAMVDERVVGFAIAGPAQDGHDPDPDWELGAIYLLQDWYGTGTAQALAAATVGHGPAQVWVLADNARARAFYRRIGFIEDGTEVTLHRLDGLRELRMVRRDDA